MGIIERMRALLGSRPREETVAATPEARKPERRQRARRDAREGTRVLIIDDSPTIVAALKKFLRSAGCQFLAAANAEQGLALAGREKPDLVFLDIVLPGMNGFAALRVLRRDPALREVPVIMMSGNEQATEQFFGSRIGADDFMKKPFSRQEVFARIERLLDEDAVPRRARSKESADRPQGRFAVGALAPLGQTGAE